MKHKFSLPSACLLLSHVALAGTPDPPQALVLSSDFGLTERFVASMKGVALSVDRRLQIHDLTHQIEPFNVWQASYQLAGTVDYWPEGTVFVSVVDPGVGTERRSVVAKTKSGHYVVTPDNGSLTLVEDKQGIAALRHIDETVNRRPDSEDSHTFHGRDVYAYTGARLAAGVIDFDNVGALIQDGIVRVDYQRPKRLDDNSIVGNIAHIEMPFGNVVTNISKSMVDELGVSAHDSPRVRVTIAHAGKTVFEQSVPYAVSFGYVDKGQPLLYADSLQVIGLALNSGNFSRAYEIKAGAQWNIRLEKIPVSAP